MNPSASLVDPWMTQDPAAYPPAPCRVIEVTDEVRAKDAAERAAREEAQQREVTWRRPESLPDLPPRPRAVNYQFPSGRSRGKRPSMKKAIAPAQITKGDETMAAESSKKPIRKICQCRPDCGIEYEAIGNAQRYAPGHKPSQPHKHAAKKTGAVRHARTAAPKLPARVESKPEMVSISVPVAALDNFWLRLTTETKVRAVERFLAGELS